jgi:hypothetical protein
MGIGMGGAFSSETDEVDTPSDSTPKKSSSRLQRAGAQLKKAKTAATQTAKTAAGVAIRATGLGTPLYIMDLYRKKIKQDFDKAQKDLMLLLRKRFRRWQIKLELEDQLASQNVI